MDAPFYLSQEEGTSLGCTSLSRNDIQVPFQVNTSSTKCDCARSQSHFQLQSLFRKRSQSRIDQSQSAQLDQIVVGSRTPFDVRKCLFALYWDLPCSTPEKLYHSPNAGGVEKCGRLAATLRHYHLPEYRASTCK